MPTGYEILRELREKPEDYFPANVDWMEGYR